MPRKESLKKDFCLYFIHFVYIVTFKKIALADFADMVYIALVAGGVFLVLFENEPNKMSRCGV